MGHFSTGVNFRSDTGTTSVLLRPIVQVLSRRSSADFLAVVNCVLRFSPGEVHR